MLVQMYINYDAGMQDLQCSNWEQRPLTVEQQVYAAADAHCLLVAYDILESDASESVQIYLCPPLFLVRNI